MKVQLREWIVSGLFLLFLLALVLSIPTIVGLSIAKNRQQRIEMMLDLKTLTFAAQAYAQDNAGVMPDAPIGVINSRRLLARTKPAGLILWIWNDS